MSAPVSRGKGKRPCPGSLLSTPIRPRRKPVQRELRLQQNILAYLHARRVFAWITYQPLIPGKGRKMYHPSSTGVSDILGVFQGKALAIEVKMPNGRISDHQRAFLVRFAKEGGIAFVARNIDDVERELWPRSESA